MSWQHQKTEIKQQIADFLSKITALNADDLARTEELGKKLSYESGVQLFKAVIDFFRRFAEADISFLSTNNLHQVLQACREISERFDQILTVDLTTQSSPAASRDSYIQQLDDTFGQYMSFLSSILAASGQETLSLREKEKKVERLMTELREKAAEAEGQTKEILTSMRSTLRKVQDAAAKAGVANHAVHFDTEAKQYEKSSAKWLKRTVGMAVLALAVTVTFAWNALTSSPDIGQSVQIAVSKIAILAVLYAGMIWSARIYRSERHNWTVNRHRRNALLSFETFVAASTDGPTKNAVLLQATESIFGHQPSGFSDKTQESGAPKILEIFRGLSGGAPE